MEALDEREDTADPLLMYIRSMRRPLLTKEQEIVLAKRIERGDQRAKDELVEANMRLVMSIARPIAHGTGVPVVDLCQEGNIGLIRAAEKFDWRKGFKFSTYATWWIRQAVARGLCKYRDVPMPVHAHDGLTKLRMAYVDFVNAGVDPTAEDYADATGLRVDQVETLLVHLAPVLPTEVELEGGDLRPRADLVTDHALAEEEAIEAADALWVRELVWKLGDPRLRRVIELRFGLEGPPETLEQVGRRLGVTRERVRQLQGAALRQLRTFAIEEGRWHAE